MSRRAIRRVAAFDDAPIDRRLAVMLRVWDDDFRANVSPSVRKHRYHMDARALALVKEKARRRRLAKRRALPRSA